MATDKLTAQDVVLDLLRYVGVTGFSAPANDQALNQPGFDADDARRAIAAINSALQTIQKYGPQSLRYDQRAAYFAAPTTATIAVSQGATAAVASAPLDDSVEGCSVRLEGDSDLNRIMSVDDTDVVLLRPYNGPTGSKSATIYFDCAILPADVQSIQEPVYGSERLLMKEARSLDHFERLRRQFWLFPRDGYWGVLYTVESIINQVGRPAIYITERRRNGQLRLRVTPMPPSAMNTTFQAALRAERIANDAIDTDGGADPNYNFTSLHDDEVESLLLPIARQRFFTHPALKNAETRVAIKDEYQEVMLNLRNGSAFHTSVSRRPARFI